MSARYLHGLTLPRPGDKLEVGVEAHSFTRFLRFIAQPSTKPDPILPGENLGEVRSPFLPVWVTLCDPPEYQGISWSNDSKSEGHGDQPHREPLVIHLPSDGPRPQTRSAEGERTEILETCDHLLANPIRLLGSPQPEVGLGRRLIEKRPNGDGDYKRTDADAEEEVVCVGHGWPG